MWTAWSSASSALSTAALQDHDFAFLLSVTEQEMERELQHRQDDMAGEQEKLQALAAERMRLQAAKYWFSSPVHLPCLTDMLGQEQRMCRSGDAGTQACIVHLGVRLFAELLDALLWLQACGRGAAVLAAGSGAEPSRAGPGAASHRGAHSCPAAACCCKGHACMHACPMLSVLSVLLLMTWTNMLAAL